MANNNSGLLYESDTFSNRLKAKMKYFREQGILFDFTIQVQDAEFKVHKLILAASSDYFQAMFLQDESKEVTENKVRLEDISVSAVNSIIDFCYTSELKLDDDNVQEIICAASRLQVIEIQELAIEYIRDRIDVSNCLGVYMLAKQIHLPDLLDSALTFCLQNYRRLVNEPEFLELDEFCLLDLISHDQLDIDNEEIVLSSVIQWTKKDPATRKPILNKLMVHVRFATMDIVNLIESASEPIIQDLPECKKCVDDAKNFLLLERRPEIRIRMGLEGERFMLRNSLKRQQRIIVVGGWTNGYKPFEKAEKYDPYSDTWIEVSPMIKPRCGVGATILGRNLYAIGGHDGHTYLSSVERYDIELGVWSKEVAKMKIEKTSVGVVTHNGYIYAIGGQIDSSPTSASNMVERYDPTTNTWKTCAPMNHKRLGAGVAVLDGYIYAVGGSHNLQTTLNTAERYDTEKDRWTPIANMLESRKHLNCEAYDGKLYAIGGRDNGDEFTSGECYIPIANTWEKIAPMTQGRSGHGLVQLDGFLYAIGGRNKDIWLKTVEAYDVATNTWTSRRSMNYERVGAGVAVYSKVQRRSAHEDEN